MDVYALMGEYDYRDVTIALFSTEDKALELASSLNAFRARILELDKKDDYIAFNAMYSDADEDHRRAVGSEVDIWVQKVRVRD